MDSLRKYIQAYNDVFKSGLVKEEAILRHIEQQTIIDQYLPDSAAFFYIVDFPSQQYRFVGKQQESVSGYSNKEMLDQGVGFFLQRLHPEEIEIIINQIYKDFEEVIANTAPQDKKKIQMQYNYRFKRKNDTYINLLEQAYVLEVDSAGKVAVSLGNVIILDTTERLPQRASAKILRKNGITENLFSKIYSPSKSNTYSITPREMDILKNLAAGKSSKEIADELCISPHTVDTHRRNLLRKLECKSVVELAQFAFKNALL